MGRWAMYRRRGSTGVPPLEAIQVLSVTAVEGDPTFARWIFTGEHGAESLDVGLYSELQIDGNVPASIDSLGVNQVVLEYGFEVAGEPWGVNAQPAAFAAPLDFPEDGTVA